MNRTTTLTAITLVLGLALAAAPARAAIVIDSLDNTITATSVIDTGTTSGKAVNFIMPAGYDYALTTVVLELSSINNNEDPLVQIWSNEATSTPIGTLLETLSDPGTLVNGLNTFTSSGLTLEAGETYWVIVRNLANSFGWPGSASDTTVDSDIGATHNGRRFPASGQASNPGIWSNTSGVLNRLQVNASVIPAPAALPAGLALIAIVAARRAGRRRD